MGPGSRRSSATAAVLALTITMVMAAGAGLSAHRVDEYLQAARLAIDPDRVRFELDLTPGIALAGAVVAEIDRNRDGVFSAEEQRAYATLVLGALTLEADGSPVRPRLSGAAFPEINAIRRGEGTIRLHSEAAFPPLSSGVHHLLFRNRHQSERSVYLANALVPGSDRVGVTAQRRDRDQTELTIDYVLRDAPAHPLRSWLLGAMVAATALSALWFRPSR
jgi:hypothetical protein